MSLMDNSKKEENGKDKILLGIIIFLIVLSICLIGFIIYISGDVGKVPTKSEISVDGLVNNALSDKVSQYNNINFIPLKEIANIAGYEAYNGDYIYVSEDINKCHVIINNEEVVQFTANSNEANKIKYGANLEYVKITLENPIISLNGELYISVIDIPSALYLYCDTSNSSNIQIYTLDTLYSIYNDYAIGLGYLGIENNTTNKKAILNNVLICKSTNNKYGVIDSSGKTIIESKYEGIQYVEETGDFIVTYNGVKGIIQNQQTKLGVSYDEIEFINYANVYAVTLNKKIAIFDENGGQIVGFNFDGIGSKTSVRNAKSVEYITSKGLIVVKANGKYGLVNKQGSTVVDFTLDDVYSTTSSGSLQYYVVINGETKNINSIV